MNIIERLKRKIADQAEVNYAIRMVYWQDLVDVYSDVNLSDWDWIRVQNEYIKISSALRD